MFNTNDCVPAGTFVQLIAGDVPSPGAAPGAAWLNFTGICPPSGNPLTVIVIGGPLAAGAAPRCCADAGRARTRSSRHSTSDDVRIGDLECVKPVGDARSLSRQSDGQAR